MRPARRSLALVLAGVAALAVPSVASAETRIFGVAGEPLVTPAQLFLSADAGPSLAGLSWTGWGEATATGTGTYVLDCRDGGPDCGADTSLTRDPATVTLRDLGPCPRYGAGATAYRRATVDVTAASGTTHPELPTGYAGCAATPTRTQAKAAIAAYVGRHAGGEVTRLRLVSYRRSPGHNDVEGQARWTEKGRSHTARFAVFPRLEGTPQVRRLGSSTSTSMPARSSATAGRVAGGPAAPRSRVGRRPSRVRRPAG